MPSSKKVVLDTNLLIAAFFNKQSASYKILEKVREGEIEAFWTQSIWEEGKKILENVGADKLFYNKLEEVFKPQNEIEDFPKVQVVEDDPSDNKFLGCALKAGAKYIISNDRHLLKIKDYQGIEILPPTGFTQKYL